MNGSASCPCCRTAIRNAQQISTFDPSLLCEPCVVTGSILRRGVKVGGGDGSQSKLIPQAATSIWMAASNGDLARVQHHVQQRSVKPDLLDASGLSPLHKACRDDHVAVVKFLLFAGADPDLNNCGATPLLRCTAWESLNSLQVLLENGANVAAIDTSFQDERTALHKACDVGNVKACRILLSFGAKTDVMDRRGDTPLKVAIKNGNVQCVRLLWVQKNRMPDCVVQELVQMAVTNGKMKVVELLKTEMNVATNEDVVQCKEENERLEQERVALEKADHVASMRMQVVAMSSMHQNRNTHSMDRMDVVKKEDKGVVPLPVVLTHSILRVGKNRRQKTGR